MLIAKLGDMSFTAGGSRFVVVNIKRAYSSALSVCGSYGGKLAEIFSEEENALVIGALQEVAGAGMRNEYYIGVTNNVNGWGTGAALGYTQWCEATAPTSGPIVLKFNAAANSYCWNNTQATTGAHICQIRGKLVALEIGGQQCFIGLLA
jgi:hypothetical protein